MGRPSRRALAASNREKRKREIILPQDAATLLLDPLYVDSDYNTFDYTTGCLQTDTELNEADMEVDEGSHLNEFPVHAPVAGK